MNKSYGIYKIENLINHKVYIGQSIHIEKRWKHHKTDLNKNIHHNNYLQNAWNKYGEQNFKFEILEICNTRVELNEKETYWKNFYFPNVYNLGHTGNAHDTSYATREKISKTLTKRYKSFEGELTKKKISKTIHEINNNLTEEERKAKYKFRNPYKPWSEDKRKKANQKAKETKIIRNTWGKTYIRTDEILQKQDKIRDKIRKAVVCFDLNMNPLCFYKSATQAALNIKADEPAIVNCCRHIRKRVHNFIFRYADEIDSYIVDKIKNEPLDPMQSIIEIHYKYQDYIKKDRKVKIVQFDLNTTPLKIFNSMSDAARETNCSINGIGHCCMGYQKKTKNYIFKYLKNLDEKLIKELLENES